MGLKPEMQMSYVATENFRIGEKETINQKERVRKRIGWRRRFICVRRIALESPLKGD